MSDKRFKNKTIKVLRQHRILMRAYARIADELKNFENEKGIKKAMEIIKEECEKNCDFLNEKINKKNV